MHRSVTAVATGRSLTLLAALVGTLGAACGGDSEASDTGRDRTPGRTQFQSSPPITQSEVPSVLGEGGVPVPPTVRPPVMGATATPQSLDGPDRHAVEGDRLYLLNGHRGLMVFDIANVDSPRLIGQTAILGSPVELLVRDGVVTVLVTDWFGQTEDGTPFHGSVVRSFDSTDPERIRVVGQARLSGRALGAKVLGDVLYAVTSETDAASYGWSAASSIGSAAMSATTGSASEDVVVTAIRITGGALEAQARLQLPGSGGGTFTITEDAILFAHDVTASAGGAGVPTRKLGLDYVDISQPGVIARRGSLLIDGRLVTSGADNGRWNVSFVGRTARVLAQVEQPVEGGQTVTTFTLATADFSDPGSPTLLSTLPIAGTTWLPSARFDAARMYLVPADPFSFFEHNDNKTPIDVYDLADPRNPAYAGRTNIDGAVWNLVPAGDRLFVLGNAPNNVTAHGAYDGSSLNVNYVDVADPAEPKVLAGVPFADDWAQTPVPGAFSAFTPDAEQHLVVLPFSQWDARANRYNNGLQLLEFTDAGITRAGVAKTQGWVERGVFAKGRLLSISELSLGVIDYTDRQTPKVMSELPLARNVVNAQPAGDTLAELSSDWWEGQDVDHSTLRIVPTAQAAGSLAGSTAAQVGIEGAKGRAFRNGDLTYVVSRVRHPTACPSSPSGGVTGSGSAAPPEPCFEWTDQVQVVDHSDGRAVLRGRTELPPLSHEFGSSGPRGFDGYYAHDWYNGSDVVQVGRDMLAFRRWASGTGAYADASGGMFIVDLSDANEPTVAVTRITQDPAGWWGNMRTVGQTLYASHYEWLERPERGASSLTGKVKYYLDRIDLSNRVRPVIGASINVPGLLVAASDVDPSLIYTMDYQSYGDHGGSEFNVLQLRGNVAELQSTLKIPGYVGSTFVSGGQAYMSVQRYVDEGYRLSAVELLMIDITSPQQLRSASLTTSRGWGWLLGVEGDRLLVTSGWAAAGVDVYRLKEAAPVFDTFVRTVGWGPAWLARQGNQLFVAAGQWGVQAIDLP